jgi:putative addiction module component (TIGR02574 family)
MSLEEIRSVALELSQDQRAQLAATLLVSLPAILDDEDDGIAEARRRSRDLEEDPASACTWEEITSGIRSR